MAGQPIIRAIQAVGQVSIAYTYNTADNKLPVPSSLIQIGQTALTEIDTKGGIELTGFRLDTEFFRAMQQVQSSVQVPLLGGGAIALTNNTRCGTLSLNCTSVSYPDSKTGEMYGDDVKGVVKGAGDAYYDIVQIAQIQQAQEGGDSVGATLDVSFMVLGYKTTLQFQGVTVAEVSPLALAGNNVPDYRVVWNYLSWKKVNDESTSL